MRREYPYNPTVVYGTPGTVGPTPPLACPFALDASGNGHLGTFFPTPASYPGEIFVDGLVTGDRAAHAHIAGSGGGDGKNIIPNDGEDGPTFLPSGFDISHSVEIWAQAPTVPGLVFESGNRGVTVSGDFREWVQVLTDGRVRWFWTAQLDVVVGGTQSVTAPAGTWPLDGNPHHLVCTYTWNPAAFPSRSVSNFYIDGALAYSTDVTHGFSTGAARSWWAIVVGQEADHSDPKDATFDEFALYDHVLSSGSISAHYAARTDFPTYNSAVLADDPAVYYHFNCTE